MPARCSSPISRPKNASPATRALRESEDTASASRLSDSDSDERVQHDRRADPGQLPLQELLGRQREGDGVEEQPGHERDDRFSASSTQSLPST